MYYYLAVPIINIYVTYFLFQSQLRVPKISIILHKLYYDQDFNI